MHGVLFPVSVVSPLYSGLSTKLGVARADRVISFTHLYLFTEASRDTIIGTNDTLDIEFDHKLSQ